MSKSTLPDSGSMHGVPPQSRDGDLAEALAQDERRQGRPHTAGERRAFIEGFVQESTKLAAWKITR